MPRLIPLLLLSLLSLAAQGADPTEQRLRALVARLPIAEQDFVAKSAYAGEHPLSKLVSFSTRDNRLLATFHLPDDLVKRFADPAPLMIALDGSPHVWTLHRRKSG